MKKRCEALHAVKIKYELNGTRFFRSLRLSRDVQVLDWRIDYSVSQGQEFPVVRIRMGNNK